MEIGSRSINERSILSSNSRKETAMLFSCYACIKWLCCCGSENIEHNSFIGNRHSYIEKPLQIATENEYTPRHVS